MLHVFSFLPYVQVHHMVEGKRNKCAFKDTLIYFLFILPHDKLQHRIGRILKIHICTVCYFITCRVHLLKALIINMLHNQNN